MRSRRIHIDYVNDPRHSGLNALSLLIYERSWHAADSNGNLIADPTWLRSLLLAWLYVRPVEIRAALRALSSVKLISLYKSAGSSYFHIIDFVEDGTNKGIKYPAATLSRQVATASRQVATKRRRSGDGVATRGRQHGDEVATPSPRGGDKLAVARESCGVSENSGTPEERVSGIPETSETYYDYDKAAELTNAIKPILAAFCNGKLDHENCLNRLQVRLARRCSIHFHRSEFEPRTIAERFEGWLIDKQRYINKSPAPDFYIAKAFPEYLRENIE